MLVEVLGRHCPCLSQWVDVAPVLGLPECTERDGEFESCGFLAKMPEILMLKEINRQFSFLIDCILHLRTSLWWKGLFLV